MYVLSIVIGTPYSRQYVLGRRDPIEVRLIRSTLIQCLLLFFVAGLLSISLASQ